MPAVRCRCAFATPSSKPTSRCSTTPRFAPSTRPRTIAAGARRTCPPGWAMAAPLSTARPRRSAIPSPATACAISSSASPGRSCWASPTRRRTPISSSRRRPQNGRASSPPCVSSGSTLTADQAAEIERGKDFVQLKNGPFDLDLVFAPDGIERFADAWRTARGGRGLPRLPPRRHHRQQGGERAGQGSGVAPPAASVPRILAGAALAKSGSLQRRPGTAVPRWRARDDRHHDHSPLTVVALAA